MAYTPTIAAALSGATLRQLRHWRAATISGIVFAPEVSDTRHILYSFRDVVALRTCVFLRRENSLQAIRRALANLEDLGYRDHLSRYRIEMGGGTIALVNDTTTVDLLKAPGQIAVVRLSDVAKPFRTRNDVQVPDLFAPKRDIEVDPETRGGYPVIRGTRVPFDAVAGILADGVSAKDIKKFYPSVSADAARDAGSFAAYVDSYREQPSRAIA